MHNYICMHIKVVWIVLCIKLLSVLQEMLLASFISVKIHHKSSFSLAHNPAQPVNAVLHIEQMNLNKLVLVTPHTATVE